ncbi:cytochrome P450 [Streptomyces sp. NBC_00555]|uniref:cytochrome P450 n=1 Tax=Streptomyces sp. NBC_00555 TaxID=2903662 RepID=UPI002251042D|nr:cytochrome P450 [Streptomyces sp. NBC_00555]MCX5015118.1 cytochrome P450 [Streptomyces sp. NBC_00555]
MRSLHPDGFNPFAPGVMDDPYPSYRELREHSPVHFSPQTGMFFLSRYEDIATLGRDRTKLIRGSSLSGGFEQFRGTALYRILGSSLFVIDDPDHGRLKRLIVRTFTRGRVEEMIPRIEGICAQLLDRAELDPAGGVLDLIPALAHPLPFLVICEFLGLAPEDRSPFLGWTHKVLPVADPFPTDAEKMLAVDGSGAFEGFFTALIGERRSLLRRGRPLPPGLISDLVQIAEEDGERLTEDELFSLAFTLLVAGFENVTNLIANAMRALCENPGQQEDLRAEPELLNNLADETLRHYSTTQYNLREAAHDIELHGVRIPAGSRVVLLRGAANRDHRQFDAPDRFDLRRPNSATNVGFGEGATLCTGAALARLEVRIAFRELLERCGTFEMHRFRPGPTRLFWGPRVLSATYGKRVRGI